MNPMWTNQAGGRRVPGQQQHQQGFYNQQRPMTTAMSPARFMTSRGKGSVGLAPGTHIAQNQGQDNQIKSDVLKKQEEQLPEEDEEEDVENKDEEEVEAASQSSTAAALEGGKNDTDSEAGVDKAAVDTEVQQQTYSCTFCAASF